jgi:hypothetical protein
MRPLSSPRPCDTSRARRAGLSDSDRGKRHSGGKHSLCLFASANIAIDVCERWPTEADIREIAKSAAESETGLDITEQEIYEHLSRVALGAERLDDVFSRRLRFPSTTRSIR